MGTSKKGVSGIGAISVRQIANANRLFFSGKRRDRLKSDGWGIADSRSTPLLERLREFAEKCYYGSQKI